MFDMHVRTLDLPKFASDSPEDVDAIAATVTEHVAALAVNAGVP